jgi:hypothetical protein
MAAMWIFFIFIIASNALCGRTVGIARCVQQRPRGICQDKPHLSLHHPHALSVPPLLTIAFQ